MIWPIAISLTLLLFVAALWAVRGNPGGLQQPSDLAGRVQQVDLAAFRNVIDSAETEFLRRRLPAELFRRIQRQRALAALEYLDRAVGNAAILLRLGEANRESSQPEIREAAAGLAAEALRTRLLAIPVRLVLYLEFVSPGHSLSLPAVLEQYERLTYRMGRLAALQAPTEASRLVSAL